jgi:hypothetical protein
MSLRKEGNRGTFYNCNYLNQGNMLNIKYETHDVWVLNHWNDTRLCQLDKPKAVHAHGMMVTQVDNKLLHIHIAKIFSFIKINRFSGQTAHY